MHKNTLIIIVCLLVIFGIMTRLMPHEPNMTAVTAIAVVSSLYLSKRFAILLPLSIIVISDIVIGSYDWKLMLSVYGSFILIGVMSWVLQRYRSVVSIGMSLLGGSLLFFVITNTAVWFFSPWYEPSVAGLLYSYELGLPFWRNMFLGDIFYTATLIGICEASVILVHRIRSALNDHCTNPSIYVVSKRSQY